MKAAAALAVALLAGCSTAPTVAPIGPGMVIDCGPVQDAQLCRLAVDAALTRQLNPPPASEVHLRLARPDDECAGRVAHPCGPETVVATIYSGDTLQDVPLARTADGWIPFDLVR
jgi:hypothetical protein